MRNLVFLADAISESAQYSRQHLVRGDGFSVDNLPGVLVCSSNLRTEK